MVKTLANLILIPFLVGCISAPLASSQEEAAEFSRAEIDQMLAPVALYPDALLSQILMAATYPLDVVEAARWSEKNAGLEGEKAVEAVAGEDWDPSVKALVAFPRVLARMNEDLQWTRRLGDAFLSQETEVMDAIQDLREKAYAAGHLDSMEHARAHRHGKSIVIEPASPKVVYVPYYYPPVVYGGWWWPAYPPFYWGPPPGYYAGSLFIWSSGIRISPVFFFSRFYWPHRHIVVVNVRSHFPKHHFRSSRDFHKWRHDPKHRRGVAHRHRTLNRGFGRSGGSGASDAIVVRPRGEWRERRGPHLAPGSAPRQRPFRGGRQSAAPGRSFGGGNWRSPGGEDRSGFSDRPANIKPRQRSSSSWNRDRSRGGGDRRPSFQRRGGSFQSSVTGRGGSRLR